MPFFSNLKKVLNLGGDAKKKKPNLEHIAVDVDPEEVGNHQKIFSDAKLTQFD